MLLDINIVIYACQPGGEWLAQWTEDAATAVASVTHLEALGFSGISAMEEAAIRQIFATILCHPLEDEVIDRAIGLRQVRKMGTVDAIIAATALEHGLPLVTRNVDDFKQVSGLEILNPFADQG